MKKSILIAAILIMGCHPPSITETICPDGSSCAVIDCTSANYSHADCIIAFGHACNSGYDILSDKNGSYLIKCH